MLEMESPVSAITTLALSAANDPPPRLDLPSWRIFGDPVQAELASIEFIGIEQRPEFTAAIEDLSRDPDFASLVATANALDPFIMSPRIGGSRVSFEGIVTSLLSNAAKLLFAQGVEVTDSAFVRAVLENYEELKRAVRGEQVRSYSVRGLAGITLDTDTQITTPWGTIRGIQVEPSQDAFTTHPRPQTSALLLTPRLLRFYISREPQPEFPEADQSGIETPERLETLTPLLFALSSLNRDALAAPVTTFETTIVPISTGFGFSAPLYSNPWLPQYPIEGQEVKSIEDLAVTLAENHDENMQLASARTVQAISQRTDRSDALVDAVMAWENLVGTRSETVYRVTAALARLLEAEDEKRRPFRKELQDIYNVRSRVVHGDVVEPSAIQSSSDKAIRIALQAMLEIYKRGSPWLQMSSNERSERLILGEG